MLVPPNGCPGYPKNPKMLNRFFMLKRIYSKINKKMRPQQLFIQNITGGFNNLELRALLYYKTESLCDHELARAYTHTNHWRIMEIVIILNSLGFIVDVVDRSLDYFEPEDKYNLFIGLGSGNSGKYYEKYSARLTKAVKVLFATGSNPDSRIRLCVDRYDDFNYRNGLNVPYARIPDKIIFSEFLKYTDYILAIGEPGMFCNESYKDCGKPVKSFLPNSSPALGFRPSWVKTRELNKFLCFAGNGLIYKGVDILIEVFRELPEMELIICGPKEDALFQAYERELSGNGNIHYEGFVRINSDRFNELCGECAYVILNSASEGVATSVSTCMRCGLVPVTNYEVGINLDDFGFLIDNSEGMIKGTAKAVVKASSITAEEYYNRTFKTLMDSLKYTQRSFSTTFEKALLEIMHKNKLIK